MSWGERSCKRPCRSERHCNPHDCNVDCPGYKWDGETKPDSIKAEPKDKRIEDLAKKAQKLDELKRTHPHCTFHEGQRKVQKIGRNAPCPCGSGKKYKRCCLK